MIEIRTRSILIIKQDDKYLLYNDTKWNCFFFPNTPLKETPFFNYLTNYVKDTFNVKRVGITYLGNLLHTKYCVPAKKERQYQHFFYLVGVKDKIDINTLAGDVEYKWFSLDDLKGDEQIQAKNKDIVDKLLELGV